MASCKSKLNSIAFAVIILHYIITCTIATNLIIERRSPVPQSVRGIICDLNGTSVCLSKLLHHFKHAGQFFEFWAFLPIHSKISKTPLLLIGNITCKATSKKKSKVQQIEKVYRNLVNGTIWQNGMASLDIKEMKKVLQCKSDLLRQRFRRNKIDDGSNSVNTQTNCWQFWRGDGFCDLGCNTEEYDYDNGDCCYETCIAKTRRFPCGFTGFQCKTKQANAASWSKDLKLCLKWRTTGNGSQCNQAPRGKVCAPFGSMTKFYYDDTDDRKGGCRLSWSIQAQTAPSWFWSRLRLCLFTYTNGDHLQCNYGQTARMKCRKANHWLHYLDDTDSRPGGCVLRWRLMYMGML